jgi:demethylmenaquinone methyltransferase/2-methoxy-6-polyprenyl-1,4-benzoquinol methylase
MGTGIQNIFAEVPETYERVNHVLTLGLDILWRRRAARLAANRGGSRWIDVCSGTGETACYLERAAGNGTQVFAVDFSMPMLSKALDKPEARAIAFLLSDIRDLPFGDGVFDVVTISFATRNINLSRDVLTASFREFHRILKPGGLFINLETSQPPFLPMRALFHLYVKLFVKSVGAALSGSKTGYTYLSKTIPRFYPADDLSGILRAAGFADVRYRRQLMGVAAIHQAYKR